MPSAEGRRLAGAEAGEWLLPAFLAAAVLARCVIVSGKRLLFADELFTVYPAAAPFHAMAASTTDTINSSPPFYLFVAWCWAALFGPGALSLRVLSAIAAGAALALLFVVLRRAYGPLAAACGAAVAALDPEFLTQSSDARFYALLVAEVALGILLYQRLVAATRPSRGLLAANTALHACLVMTHYFGLLYSGILVAATILAGLFGRRNFTRASVSAVAGWLVFLPWIPVLRRHLEMGRPTFWIPVPAPSDLGDFYLHFFRGSASGLAALLLALTLLLLVRRRDGSPSLAAVFTARPVEFPLLLLVPLLGAAPVVTYFASVIPGGTSSFLSRYLLPTVFAWSIVWAHLSSRIFRMVPSTGRGRLLPAVVAALFVAACSYHVLAAAARLRPEPGLRPLPAAVAPDDPVVVEHLQEFMKLHYYAPDRARYLFLVDRPAGVAAGGGGPANQMIMEGLQRSFPAEFPEVRPAADYLAHATSFWVLVSSLGWWQLRVVGNPAFVTDAAIQERRLVHVRRAP